MSKTIHSADYKKMLERLREARIDSGLSQTAAANKLGKPQSYVSKIERGERRLDVTELKAFSKLYGKSITYFVA